MPAINSTTIKALAVDDNGFSELSWVTDLGLLAGKRGSCVTSLLIILVSEGSKKDELGRIDLHSKG